MRLIATSLILSFTSASAAFAFDTDEDKTVEILSVAERLNKSSKSKRVVSPLWIKAARPRTVADLASVIPSSQVRTNSRGEALFFIRGSGERETAVTVNGALLNVPWDNRIDLENLPSNFAKSASFSANPSDLVSSVRASAGVLNLLSSGTLQNIEDQTSVLIELSQENSVRLEADYQATLGDLRLTLGARHDDRDGVPLASPGGLTFSQDNPSLRTNTDRRLSAVTADLQWQKDDKYLGLTLLHSDSRFGVAPESDRDPATERVRFWRYPESLFTTVIANTGFELADHITLSNTLWYQRFNQTIDSFTSDRFQNIDDRQLDRNQTWGLTSTLGLNLSSYAVNITATGYISDHSQANIDGNSIRTLTDIESAFSLFREKYLNTTLTLTKALTDTLDIYLAGGLDYTSSPRTAGRPSVQNLTEPAWSARLIWQKNAALSFSFTGGQKSRAPTLRERFGTAINRFLENPDLLAEQTTYLEATVAQSYSRVFFSLTPFWRSTDNTLEQRSVNLGGQRLRQRFNLAGSTVYGIEIDGDIQLLDTLTINVSVTRLRARAKRDNNLQDRRLTERPEFTLKSLITYQPLENFNTSLEILHTSGANSLTAGGRIRKLATSTQINLNATYSTDVAEFYIKAENVNDEFIEFQAGLPEPGRTIRVGAVFKF